MDGVTPPHPQRSCVPRTRAPGSLLCLLGGEGLLRVLWAHPWGEGDSTLGAGQETLTLPFPSPPATRAALKSDN